MSDPIRVYIACSPNNDDLEAQAVLDYTLCSLTSRPVEITWMKLSRDPTSPFYSDAGGGWRTRRWATPFSGFRWAVPALAGFEGKAIYLDPDFIVRADIAELWDQEFHSDKVAMVAKPGPSPRFCCSLWDCAKAKRFIPALADLQKDEEQHIKMTRFFGSRPDLLQQYVGEWNALDNMMRGLAFDDPRVKAIHYTHMPTQPHLMYARARLRAVGREHWIKNGKPHPSPLLQSIFDTALREAQAAGYTLDKYTNDAMYGVRQQ